MAIDNSRILLNLPAMPDDSIPPELYDDFVSIYNAIRSLLSGVSVYGGIDAPAVNEVEVLQEPEDRVPIEPMRAIARHEAASSSATTSTNLLA